MAMQDDDLAPGFAGENRRRLLKSSSSPVKNCIETANGAEGCRLHKMNDPANKRRWRLTQFQPRVAEWATR